MRIINAGMAAQISPHLVEPAALRAWLQSWHDTTFTLNARSVIDKFMASDIEWQYANFPVLSGKEAVYESFNAACQNLDYMYHEIKYFDLVGNHLYQAVTIDYVVKGDNRDTNMITIPAIWSAWLVEEDGGLKVKRSEIYLDASKVFGRMAEKGLL